MNKWKERALGFLAGSIFFAGASYAAPIDMQVLPLHFFFDNVEKAPPSDQQAFVFNGRTYVPLRFMGEAMGKEVSYDGEKLSVYIGKQPEGQMVYLQDMQTVSRLLDVFDHDVLTPHDKGKAFVPTATFETNRGEKFLHSYWIGKDFWYPSYGKFEFEYVLNGGYSKFQALIAPESDWKNGKRVGNLGQVKVYSDDKLVFDSGFVASDISSPIQADVSLKGALRVKIEGWGTDIGLCDAKFVR